MATHLPLVFDKSHCIFLGVYNIFITFFLSPQTTNYNSGHRFCNNMLSKDDFIWMWVFHLLIRWDVPGVDLWYILYNHVDIIQFHSCTIWGYKSIYLQFVFLSFLENYILFLTIFVMMLIIKNFLSDFGTTNIDLDLGVQELFMDLHLKQWRRCSKHYTSSGKWRFENFNNFQCLFWVYDLKLF